MPDLFDIQGAIGQCAPLESLDRLKKKQHGPIVDRQGLRRIGAPVRSLLAALEERIAVGIKQRAAQGR
ncbi:hypothetical protein [Leisingera sp. D0M16]|uniref:hypothetical protein n=1 Tax=Leisingera coralii TaxID=3351347 RepID=UPI003BA3BE0E